MGRSFRDKENGEDSVTGFKKSNGTRSSEALTVCEVMSNSVDKVLAAIPLSDVWQLRKENFDVEIAPTGVGGSGGVHTFFWKEKHKSYRCVSDVGNEEEPCGWIVFIFCLLTEEELS